MKKILLISSLFAMGAFGASMTGVISEDHCKEKHNTGSAADQACVKKCVEGGAKPVFVSDGKVYTIDDPSKVQSHLGQKVTVNGEVSGDSIKITSVKAAKAKKS